MSQSIRYCAYCDQPVEAIPTPTKEWTKATNSPEGFKHIRTSKDGVVYCGRQFLAEHETYTEGDRE